MTEQQNENGSAPTIEQICWQMGQKISAMEQELANLKKNGNETNANDTMKEEIVEKVENDGNGKDEALDGQIVEMMERMNKLEKENEQLKTEMAKLREEKADKQAVKKLSECIEEMNVEIQAQHLTPNNKWILEEDEQYLSILEGSDELVVVKSAGSFRNGKWNSVRAEMPIPDFKWNTKKPYIAVYFEVSILQVTDRKIQIGFCDKEFPLNGPYIGGNSYPYSSIGICHKGGMRVNGEFKHFEKVNGNGNCDFSVGVVGVGLIHSPVDSTLKAFASCDGEFLGSIELPAYFCGLELYPAASLFYKNDKIEANFGKTEWAFNPYQLVPTINEEHDENGDGDEF